MFWRVKSFPELQHLPPAGRKRLLRQCIGIRGWVGLFAHSVMLGGAVGGWAAILIARCLAMDGAWRGSVVLAGFLAGAVLMYQFELIRIRGQLLIYLEKLGKRQRLPMCLNCGYDHEGLTSDTCPECGMRRRQ